MNILITSAGREVALIKAFKNALRQEKGKVICIDINPLSVAFFYADLSYLVPEYASPLFIPKILKICKKHSIKLIIPTKDAELLLFAKAKEEFKKIGVTIMISNFETIEVCHDKLKFVEFCQGNNILVPKTYSMEEIKDGKIDFPLFINDRFGKGSHSAFKINNKNELDLYLNFIKNPIVQEYISEKEYTIDLFSDFQGNVISVVPRERIYTFGGESFIGKTYKNKKLIRAAIDISQKLGLIGHNTIQCFFNGQAVQFIEINPRYGGGANLGFAAGSNTPLYLIKLLKGEKIKNKIGEFKENLIMLRHTVDIFIEKKDLRCKKI